jgi:hypothetical protein
MKKFYAFIIGLIMANPAAATIIAGLTGITAAVVLRFDDPIVWGAASAGVAYGFFRTEFKDWRFAMANGIAGFNFGGFGGPWLTAEIADRLPHNPVPGYLVAFMVAAFWPQAVQFIWPLLGKVLKTLILGWGKR